MPESRISNVSGTDETRYYRYYPDASRLVEGRNVIAVEVHQRVPDSSDLGFDLELKGRRGVTGPTSGVALVPGINRIRVRAFDGPNGTGNEVAAGYIDVWYDAGTVPADVSGTLPSDTVLTKAGGPWRVTGDLIVPAGVTLTIEPGATLFFETGTQMIVYGRLVCEGTETDRIRLTWQYYVKSREAGEYRKMVADQLYHPPSVSIHVDDSGELVLNHRFEGKPLVREFINATLMGVEFLWGSPVVLYTSEPVPSKSETMAATDAREETPARQYSWKRFRYTMKDRRLTRELVE